MNRALLEMVAQERAATQIKSLGYHVDSMEGQAFMAGFVRASLNLHSNPVAVSNASAYAGRKQAESIQLRGSDSFRALGESAAYANVALVDESSPEPASPLVTRLSTLLADAFSFYLQAHGAHWNVVGPDFGEYHALFQKIYEESYEVIDPLAEILRKLGGMAPFELGKLDELSTIPGKEAGRSANALATSLLEANSALLAEYKAAFDAATAAREQGICNFLADQIDNHEMWRWQLAASLGIETPQRSQTPTGGLSNMNRGQVEIMARNEAAVLVNRMRMRVGSQEQRTFTSAYLRARTSAGVRFAHEAGELAFRKADEVERTSGESNLVARAGMEGYLATFEYLDTRNWKKWHEQHPYVPHPRQKGESSQEYTKRLKTDYSKWLKEGGIAGRSIKASSIKPGHILHTANGPERVTHVERHGGKAHIKSMDATGDSHAHHIAATSSVHTLKDEHFAHAQESMGKGLTKEQHLTLAIAKAKKDGDPRSSASHESALQKHLDGQDAHDLAKAKAFNEKGFYDPKTDGPGVSNTTKAIAKATKHHMDTPALGHQQAWSDIADSLDKASAASAKGDSMAKGGHHFEAAEHYNQAGKHLMNAYNKGQAGKTKSGVENHALDAAHVAEAESADHQAKGLAKAEHDKATMSGNPGTNIFSADGGLASSSSSEGDEKMIQEGLAYDPAKDEAGFLSGKAYGATLKAADGTGTHEQAAEAHKIAAEANFAVGNNKEGNNHKAKQSAHSQAAKAVNNLSKVWGKKSTEHPTTAAGHTGFSTANPADVLSAEGLKQMGKTPKASQTPEDLDRYLELKKLNSIHTITAKNLKRGGEPGSSAHAKVAATLRKASAVQNSQTATKAEKVKAHADAMQAHYDLWNKEHPTG